MKYSSLILFIFLCQHLSLGQNSLPESRQWSPDIFVYKLDKKDMRALHFRNKNLNEEMLHTYILKYPDGENVPELPRGNYVLVQAAKNKLQYTEYIVDNFHYKIVKNEKVMLFLSDTLGNIISNAVVKGGNQKLKFNPATRTYNTSKVSDEKVIEVENNGVYHYIEFEKDYYNYRNKPLNKTRWKITGSFNRIFTPRNYYVSNKYNGFVVFSKPRYKPGETVKFKAYIHKNGIPYNKEVDVKLSSYIQQVDTVLTRLKPYRAGMYNWEFKLSDSLKLKLDSYYYIKLNAGHKQIDAVSSSFEYEDYELGKINFSAKTSKNKYTKADTVKINFDIHDENEMPIYDGRVNVSVTHVLNDENMIYHSGNIFIPYLIWNHTFQLSDMASQEIILPDSIFIDNISMNYNIECEFLDTSNEKHIKHLKIYRSNDDRLIDFKYKSGLLIADEMESGKSITTKALFTAYNPESEILFEDSVTLPYSFPILWNASEYKVVTPTASGTFMADEIKEDLITYRFFRQNDSIWLTTNNPAKLPFWYTIRKNKKIIEKGYATDLNYSLKDKGKNGYTMQISYLFGENNKMIQGQLPYEKKNISMEVNTSTTVYPGQTVPVEVAVKDKKGRPIKNVDITAYAFTSKFGNIYPDISIYGKSKQAKKFNNKSYKINEDIQLNYKTTMNWDLWKQRMQLDSIEYYKFLYPQTVYSYTQPAPDKTSQISPYVVIDGNVQGVHILWIDGEPHYFNQAQQLNVYSFPVFPGYHTLKLRTHNREIIADNIYVEPGAKTILSINGKESATYAQENKDKEVKIVVNKLNRKGRKNLSEQELSALKPYMITVDDNFGHLSLNNMTLMKRSATIDAGGVYYYLHSNNYHAIKHNYRTTLYEKNAMLIGPFPYRGFFTQGKNIGSLYADTSFINNFEIEGGFKYNIWKNYIKQTSWKINPVNKKILPFTPDISFTEYALTKEKTDSINKSKLYNMLKNTDHLLNTNYDYNTTKTQKLSYFNLILKEKKNKTEPLIIYITSVQRQETIKYLYGGKTHYFYELPEGEYNISLIFSDSTRHSSLINLQKNGANYLYIDSLMLKPADSICYDAFNLLDSLLVRTYPASPVSDDPLVIDKDTTIILPYFTTGRYNTSAKARSLITGTIVDNTGEPLIGANIMIKGTGEGVCADIDGKFSLPSNGTALVTFSYMGFEDLTINLYPGYDYKITLEDDDKLLEDIVVVGYGTLRKESVVGSVGYLPATDISAALQGRLAGIQVTNSKDNNSDTPPMMIVDGVPYEGALSDFAPEDIISMNVVKNGDTSLYGARASNGIIFIETKSKSNSNNTNLKNDFPTDWKNANALRTNFHDDAFWQPILTTNKEGKLNFEVTYPDDITSWTANFIAVGGRKKTDFRKLNIKSFKPLSAQLSVPQFAIEGDSINIIGKLTNHVGDTVIVERNVMIEEETYSSEDIRLFTSHTDTIPLTISHNGDSMKVVYSLEMIDGYFDGEQRSIPVYKPGVLESNGQFTIINDTSTYKFATDSLPGNVIVYAESSVMKIFLEEIEKTDRYPYMCNEQMASKLKALLAKKQIYSLTGINFKEDRKIRNLISQINKNRNEDNLWGWWNNSKTQFWISKQVLEALLHAQANGYNAEISTEGVIHTLIYELNRKMSASGKAPERQSIVKNDLLDILMFLKKLNAKVDYTRYMEFISSMEDNSLTSKLKAIELKYQFDVDQKPYIDTLMKYSQLTVMGSLYWGENEKQEMPYIPPITPNVSNIENTLTAYRILKNTGGHDTELANIRNYFFETRKSGSWRNTYESSRILETIMPDMVQNEATFRETGITINGKHFDKFPVNEIFDAGSEIIVNKTGTFPVFFTIYQQTWNEKPIKTSKGFTIETSFDKNGNTVEYLKAGETIKLKILITADSDTEYTMLEIPIPAGCSYENKSKGSFWKEAHREYYKEKINIFCNMLTKGEHEFTVTLIPRYTGSYRLNPAKVELMYYPVFFGREEMKTCDIVSDK